MRPLTRLHRNSNWSERVRAATHRPPQKLKLVRARSCGHSPSSTETQTGPSGFVRPLTVLHRNSNWSERVRAATHRPPQKLKLVRARSCGRSPSSTETQTGPSGFVRPLTVLHRNSNWSERVRAAAQLPPRKLKLVRAGSCGHSPSSTETQTGPSGFVRPLTVLHRNSNWSERVRAAAHRPPQKLKLVRAGSCGHSPSSTETQTGPSGFVRPLNFLHGNSNWSERVRAAAQLPPRKLKLVRAGSCGRSPSSTETQTGPSGFVRPLAVPGSDAPKVGNFSCRRVKLFNVRSRK